MVQKPRAESFLHHHFSLTEIKINSPTAKFEACFDHEKDSDTRFPPHPMPLLFKSIGAAGLLLISLGIITKKRSRQDWLYIAGGLCLEAYSIYLGDLIFTILQIVFTAAAVYDLVKKQPQK